MGRRLQWMAGLGAGALLLVLLVFQEDLTRLFRADSVSWAIALFPSLYGFLVSMAIGNSAALTLTWVIPLALLNAAAVFLLPSPVNILVRYGVVLVVVGMTLSSTVSLAWSRFVMRLIGSGRPSNRA
jgi:hypothetical protein